MWTDVEIGYLAGMIDGEGSIYIQDRKQGNYKHYFPRFQITNTNKEVMYWIKETFGGTIYLKKRNHIKPHWKDQVEWFTTRESMDKLLPLIIPHLIIKKKHAKIMQEFRATFSGKAGGKRVPEESLIIRERCYKELKRLNQRGPLLSSPLSPSSLR
jgi:hypothetical protein